MNDQRRERLEDAWDEAALELLMDDYAEIAGSELYEEYLSNLEQGKVEELPADLDKSCQNLIQSSFSAEPKVEKGDWINAAICRVCKAAMVVLAIFGATATIVVSVDALRVPIFNFFLKQEQRYTIVSSSEEADDLISREHIENIRDYIPREYKIVYETYFGDGYYNLRYKNGSGDIISIRAGEGDIELYADTEDATFEKIDINGKSALFIQKNGMRIIVQKANSQAVLDFYAEAMEESDFFRIADLLSDM